MAKNGKKILVAGASGTIGTELVLHLQASGYEVCCLQRVDPQAPYYWNPEKGELDVSLEGFDAVINLAGSPIIGGRWGKNQKEKIYKSRIEPTKALVEAMSRSRYPPKVFISASATGIYTSGGFLADVCTQWEAEAQKASFYGVRVALLRIGIVLTKKGGILAKMLPSFRLGFGAIMGSGKQWMSWISIQDLVLCIQHVIETEALYGPINAVAPNPVTNEEFSKSLAKALHRPCWLRIPSWVLCFILGEMAEETVLSSVKVYPDKLRESGFRFQDSVLKFLV